MNELPAGFEWYVPTWYGDVRLRVLDRARTRVEVTTLTRGELAALNHLKEISLKKHGLFRRPWATLNDWSTMPKEAFQVRGRAGHVTLKASIHRVERALTGYLRGHLETMSVVITDKGNLYEVCAPPPRPDEETNLIPFRRPYLVKNEEKPVAATTVRKPIVGCPAPNFQEAHERASQVLQRFLSADQIEDYETYQKFVTVGAETGHRYILTSRHARSSLSETLRTVYDVEERRPYCVHDWGVPAPEELLTMHLFLSVPGGETYIRGLQDEEDNHLSERFGNLQQPRLSPPPEGYLYDYNGDLRPRAGFRDPMDS